MYDLVIIGNTLEAFFAASQAIKFKARVALVLGNNNKTYWQEFDNLILKYFTDLRLQGNDFIQGNIKLDSVVSLDINQFIQWKNEVRQNITIANLLEILANSGVDIVEESGEFCRLPKLGFILKNRTLRSRRYLLAMGFISKIPQIETLEEIGYTTLETLNIQGLPDRLVILSKTFIGIELAQQLNRLGKHIVLILEKSNIFLQEDKDTLKLLTAILEAEGIKLLINCSITQVKKIDNNKWIQVGDVAIETDEIIITDPGKANTEKLNLEGVQVEIEGDKIKTNEKLQTTNPKIYACGNVMTPYPLSNIAQYEANIAVKNAIFYPIFKLNYDYHPIRLLTHPTFSRVGLTETQARQHYNNDIIIIKDNFKNSVKAKISNESTGFCKLMTRRNGVILGCHIIGPQSDEIINLIAVAIKNKIKIEKLSQVFPPYGTASQMIFQMFEEWQRQKYQESKVINNCLETLLFWRRKWNQ